MSKPGPFRVPVNIEELWGIVRALLQGLLSLNFEDNFDSWKATVTIGAGSELAVRNQFRDGRIPTEWVVVDQTGNGLLTRGSSTWTSDFVYLYNNGASSVTADVRFFK